MPNNLKFVQSADQIRENVLRFTSDLAEYRDLAADLVKLTEYWVVDEDARNFAPTKFVGIRDITFPRYAALREEANDLRHGGRHGRAGFAGGRTGRTGQAIQKVLGGQYEDSPELRRSLSEWCAQRFGNLRIRTKTQFVRLRPDGKRPAKSGADAAKPDAKGPEKSRLRNERRLSSTDRVEREAKTRSN